MSTSFLFICQGNRELCFDGSSDKLSGLIYTDDFVLEMEGVAEH